MYRHIFDRSDLDQVVAINPRTKESWTRLQDLQRDDMWNRQDIVLFNGTRSGKSYELFVTSTGFSGDLWLLDILTDTELTKVEGIAQRMRDNARKHEACKRLLADHGSLL